MNENIEIKHYKNIKNTPAVPLLMAEWQESLTYWPGRQDYSFDWDHEAMVLFLDDTPIGVIDFMLAEYCRNCQLTVGYIKPEFRRRGFYNKLWTHFISHLKSEGKIDNILSYSIITNPVIHEVSRKQGRHQFATVYRYSL
jgi:ribosomal protein S18 acetylase RimI-like enzyme